MSYPNVAVFGMTGCKYCRDAKALLTSQKAPFKYYKMDSDGIDYFKSIGILPSDWDSVPIILVNGTLLGGYDTLVKRVPDLRRAMRKGR